MSHIVLFMIIWWLCFYIALPIHVKEEEIKTKKLYKKEIKKAYLKIKILIVTIISIPATYFIKDILDQILLDYFLN